tara:strand:+ start:251 stop:760 length:510 start_codon:yes stop_codon:yes gene_type:complete
MQRGYVRLKTDRNGLNLLTLLSGGHQKILLFPRDDVSVKPGDIVEYKEKSRNRNFIISEEYSVVVPSRYDLVIKGKRGKPDFIYGSWDGRKGLFKWERFPWRPDRKIFGKDYAVTVQGQLNILLERIPQVNDVTIEDNFRSFGNCTFTESLMDRRNMLARNLLRDILRN